MITFSQLSFGILCSLIGIFSNAVIKWNNSYQMSEWLKFLLSLDAMFDLQKFLALNQSQSSNLCHGSRQLRKIFLILWSKGFFLRHKDFLLEAPNIFAMKRNPQECETLSFKRTGCHGRSLGQPVQIAGNKEHEGAPIYWWGEKDLIIPGFVEHLAINKWTEKRSLNWIKPKSAQPSLVEYNLWGMTHCIVSKGMSFLNIR